MTVVSYYMEIKNQIKEMNLSLMVASDIMFVSWIPFLIIVLCSRKLTTAEYIPKHMATILSKYLKKVYDIYLGCRFTVELFLVAVA